MLGSGLSRFAAACGVACSLMAAAPLANGARQSGAPPRPDGLQPPAQVRLVPGVVAHDGFPAWRLPIPAGEFWMGRTRLWLMDEIGWQVRERMDDRPVHRVRLPAFAMDAYEVTNADYARFVAQSKGAVAAPFHWGGPTPLERQLALPVYNVTWFDAAKYCAAAGGRLPTEAEWEYAARGGVADRDYPWGDDYTDVTPSGAVTRHAHSGSSTGPKAVVSYRPNGYSLHDMSGNVWEWTADWYDLHYYSVSPVDNPTGPASGRYKVIRGGSWADTETRLGTVYFRNFTAPDTAQPTVGFRCAGPATGAR